MVVFFAFVMGIGYLFDRHYGLGGMALAAAAAYSSVSALVGFYTGDRVALAMSGAKPIRETDNPYLYRMVENLCIATGTPMPKVHVIDDPAINAFAAGRNPEHASIAVTTGALRKLENEELEGVLAHEMSHIRNYDIRLMTLVIVLVGTVSILADIFLRSTLFGRRRDSQDGGGNGLLAIVGIVMVVLSPIVAQLVKLAVSRRREFLADSSAALITRFPEGLARALAKIRDDNTPMRRASGATAHLFISNPLRGNALSRMFSTHPPIEDRIAALKRMG
ncbi:M48 family metallopeptidase [Candidatus Uhrbacteria bacterium]|nr:M48 family metallopeptidase [Candidatus Uhrbacteria bacterium]